MVQRAVHPLRSASIRAVSECSSRRRFGSASLDFGPFSRKLSHCVSGDSAFGAALESAQSRRREGGSARLAGADLFQQIKVLIGVLGRCFIPSVSVPSGERYAGPVPKFRRLLRSTIGTSKLSGGITEADSVKHQQLLAAWRALSARNASRTSLIEALRAE